LHPHPHRPPNSSFAPSGSIRSGRSKGKGGACFGHLSAVGLWLRGLPPWDTILVLCWPCSFQPTGKHGNPLLREARGSSPCIVLRPCAVIHIYDSHMPSRVGAHRLLFFYSNTRDWTAKVKQTCHWSYNILFYSVGEKTEANKVDYIYHIRLRAFDLDKQFLSAIPRSYRCERDDTETRCSSQPPQRLRRGAHYILAILATLSHLLHPATPAVKAHHAPIHHGLVGHRSTGP
jgi:hypothetical protein